MCKYSTCLFWKACSKQTSNNSTFLWQVQLCYEFCVSASEITELYSMSQVKSHSDILIYIYPWSNTEYMIKWYTLKHQFMNLQPWRLYFYPFALIVTWENLTSHSREHNNSVLVLAYRKAGLSLEPWGITHSVLHSGANMLCFLESKRFLHV